MAEMLPFGYAGFYDVPRFMVLRFRGVTLVLRSPFDESLDEYPDTYSVHQVPRAIEDAVMAGDYGLLNEATLQPLGQIAINRVAFDPTKRHALSSECLEELFA